MYIKIIQKRIKKENYIMNTFKIIYQYLNKIFHFLIVYSKHFFKYLHRFFSSMRVSENHFLLSWKQLSHLGLFSFVFVYYELLLRIFTHTGLFFQSIISNFIWNFFWFIVQLLYILFIKKINRRITLFILCSSSLIFIIECIVKNTFQVYMSFSSILKGAGGVTTGFTSDMFKQIFLVYL